MRVERHLMRKDERFSMSLPTHVAPMGPSHRPVVPAPPARGRALAICTVCLCVSMLAIVCVLYFEARAAMATMASEAQPFVRTLMNHTTSVFANADASSVRVSDVMDNVALLAQDTVPAIERALNRTERMLARTEQLVADPVMHIRFGAA